jgi:hypothetical protein
MTGNELLATALEAHGGAERWSQLDQVVLDVRSGGFAPLVKGRRREVARYRAWISTREPRAVFAPYPRAGQRGVFERDEVRIESDEGQVLQRRTDPRSHFGFRRQLWWDHLDLLHFAGYAMWGYACAPFLFAGEGFGAHEIEPWDEEGERWRRLAVTFPPQLPAHSREQVFHFDGTGRLRRNDYTAEVFGSWVKAAHYCHDHREFGGIVFPTRRRVYPRARSGRPRPGPLLVRIDIDSVELVERDGA